MPPYFKQQQIKGTMNRNTLVCACVETVFNCVIPMSIIFTINSISIKVMHFMFNISNFALCISEHTIVQSLFRIKVQKWYQMPPSKAKCYQMIMKNIVNKLKCISKMALHSVTLCKSILQGTST